MAVWQSNAGKSAGCLSRSAHPRLADNTFQPMAGGMSDLDDWPRGEEVRLGRGRLDCQAGAGNRQEEAWRTAERLTPPYGQRVIDSLPVHFSVIGSVTTIVALTSSI
jgi:hypothetical protein